MKIAWKVSEGIFNLDSKPLLNIRINLNRLNKPHSQIRNTIEQGATWTLKWKGGKQHSGERGGVFFVGGRASLVTTPTI